MQNPQVGAESENTTENKQKCVPIQAARLHITHHGNMSPPPPCGLLVEFLFPLLPTYRWWVSNTELAKSKYQWIYTTLHITHGGCLMCRPCTANAVQLGGSSYLPTGCSESPGRNPLHITTSCSSSDSGIHGCPLNHLALLHACTSPHTAEDTDDQLSSSRGSGP